MLETLQNEIENDTPLPHHVVQRAADLVHPTIMRNKDSHVRLLAAQCLAELLNHPIEMPFDVPEQRVSSFFPLPALTFISPRLDKIDNISL